jgi:hypothetical protein
MSGFGVVLAVVWFALTLGVLSVVRRAHKHRARAAVSVVYHAPKTLVLAALAAWCLAAGVANAWWYAATIRTLWPWAVAVSLVDGVCRPLVIGAAVSFMYWPLSFFTALRVSALAGLELTAPAPSYAVAYAPSVDEGGDARKEGDAAAMQGSGHTPAYNPGARRPSIADSFSRVGPSDAEELRATARHSSAVAGTASLPLDWGSDGAFAAHGQPQGGFDALPGPSSHLTTNDDDDGSASGIGFEHGGRHLASVPVDSFAAFAASGEDGSGAYAPPHRPTTDSAAASSVADDDETAKWQRRARRRVTSNSIATVLLVLVSAGLFIAASVAASTGGGNLDADGNLLECRDTTESIFGCTVSTAVDGGGTAYRVLPPKLFAFASFLLTTVYAVAWAKIGRRHSAVLLHRASALRFQQYFAAVAALLCMAAAARLVLVLDAVRLDDSAFTGARVTAQLIDLFIVIAFTVRLRPA